MHSSPYFLSSSAAISLLHLKKPKADLALLSLSRRIMEVAGSLNH